MSDLPLRFTTILLANPKITKDFREYLELIEQKTASVLMQTDGKISGVQCDYNAPKRMIMSSQRIEVG